MPHGGAQSKIARDRPDTEVPTGAGGPRPGTGIVETSIDLSSLTRGAPPVNTRREPRDPAAYKRDRRQAVLRHHPDKGGDPDELLRALEEVDRRHGVIGSARGEHSASAEQVAAVAVTALAGVAAIGLSVAMSVLGRRR